MVMLSTGNKVKDCIIVSTVSTTTTSLWTTTDNNKRIVGVFELPVSKPLIGYLLAILNFDRSVLLTE